MIPPSVAVALLKILLLASAAVKIVLCYAG